MKLITTTALAGLALAGLAGAPADAEPASGYVTRAVSERDGPGLEYRIVARLPIGAPITIFGCLHGPAWCEIEWAGRHGWVAAAYVRGDYAYYEEAPPDDGGYFGFEYDEGGWRGGHRHRHHHFEGPGPGGPPFGGTIGHSPSGGDGGDGGDGGGGSTCAAGSNDPSCPVGIIAPPRQRPPSIPKGATPD